MGLLLSAVVAVLVFAFTLLWLIAWLSPSTIYNFIIRVRVIFSGCRINHVVIGNNQRVVFAERPGRPSPAKGLGTILMIHGYSSSKDTFADLIPRLPVECRVISLDLPGHGESSPVHPDEMTIDKLASFINDVCHALDLRPQSSPLHVVATSMGGAVAGVFAARYPIVTTLSLMCPVGVRIAKECPIEAAFKRDGKLLLLPRTVPDVRHLLTLNSVKQHAFIPDFIVHGFLQDRMQRNSTYEAVLLHLANDRQRYMLETELGNIKAPTFVAWGKQDQVLDPSSADVFKKNLPSCDVRLFDQCGHDMVLDCAVECGQAISEFIRRHSTQT